MANRGSNRLFIDKLNRGDYFRIRNEFKHLKLTNSDIFSLALALGFQQGIKKPLNSKFAIVRYESIPSDLLSIMMLFAIKEFGDVNEWIDNPLIIFDLAEEYSNAGIEILMELYGEDSLEDYLMKSILDLNEAYDFQSKYEEFYGD